MSELETLGDREPIRETRSPSQEQQPKRTPEDSRKMLLTAQPSMYAHAAAAYFSAQLYTNSQRKIEVAQT